MDKELAGLEAQTKENNKILPSLDLESFLSEGTSIEEQIEIAEVYAIAYGLE